MKALLFSGLAVALIASAAQARPLPRVPAKPHPTMAPLEEASTQCFAETVMANPKAIGLARAGRWYEAAGVIGFLCRPEVERMALAYDRLYGRGKGERYFKGPYARHLDKELASRLQPLLEPKTVASAETGDEAVIGEARSPSEEASDAVH